MEGERDPPEPDPPARRARRLPRRAASTRPPSRAGRATRSAVLVDGARRDRRGLRRAPPPGRPAAQPGRHPGRCRRTSRSTRRSASRPTRTGRTTRARPAPRYLTQAAVLAVRNFTSAATGLADRDRAVPRPDPPQREDDRQLLGRPDPRRPVHPAADLDRRRPRPRLAGRAPDAGTRPQTVTTLQGAQQTIALGPDRLAGVDQGAGQQRRRLPQRQLRPPVREPDAADELARDVRHPGHARSR